MIAFSLSSTITFILLLAFADASHPSTPEDLFAFPRYSITFLNGLPIDNKTAQAWLTYGLKRGLDEFLAQSPPPDAIESGDHSLVQTHVREYSPPFSDQPSTTRLTPSTQFDDGEHSTLQFMRMGPNKAFICHIPPPPPPPSSLFEESQATIPATRTWQQLSALAGTCLYVCDLFPIFQVF
jgi:protein OS-9